MPGGSAWRFTRTSRKLDPGSRPSPFSVVAFGDLYGASRGFIFAEEIIGAMFSYTVMAPVLTQGLTRG